MIYVVFTCDYPDCKVESDQVETQDIDTYTYHDAPSNGRTMYEPTGWWWDSLYHWVGCPEHKDAMCGQRDSKQWSGAT